MDFSEQQKINHPFVIGAFFVGTLTVLGAIVFTFYNAYKSGEDIYEMVWLLIFVLIIEGFAFFMVFQNLLYTSIDRDGFSYKYFPFVRKLKTISFNEIDSWQIRQIKIFNEFRGLGYQRKLFSKKTGFLMGSRNAIQLNLNNGKTFVFSTTDAYMLESAIKKIYP